MSDKPIDTSLVLDILLAEKDYVRTYRTDLDLWYRVRKDGVSKFELIAEQWRPEVNEVIKQMFRKKKMRYTMCFLESFKLIANLKPYTLKTFVYMVTHMRRDNWIKQLSIRNICDETGVSERYVQMAIKQLLQLDVVRRKKVKNTYDYIINPAFFSRASFRSIFTITETFDSLPNERLPKQKFSNFDEKSES